ncbi:MAG: NUDIX domain-containing protein [Patescibacteria group bacterium]|nr:NUDIX domain-containing protein [Patescibacteria group bacterium]
MSFTPENYQIAAKAFLVKDGRILVCKESLTENWDLPGGRIGKEEFNTSFDEVLEREIKEELGPGVKYKNNGPVVIFKHKREEITLDDRPTINILIIGFELEYIEGDVELSEEHRGYHWVYPKEALKYLSDGQLDGLKKYIRYVKNGRKKIVY